MISSFQHLLSTLQNPPKPSKTLQTLQTLQKPSKTHATNALSYFDAETVGLDFKGMAEDLRAAPNGSVVLLHGAWR